MRGHEDERVGDVDAARAQPPLRTFADPPRVVARSGARRPPTLDASTAMGMQQTVGNAAIARLAHRRGADFSMKEKIEAISGGLTDLKLDVTWNVSGQKAATLQCIQAWWGSGSTLGKKVGKTGIKIGKKDYEAFIDGGKFSPYVTLSGNDPAHPTKPYYLTEDEHKNQVTWDGEKGTIQITDLPSASALFEEMFFETAIVAVDVDGKGTDKIMRVFTWGNTKQGTVTQHEKGEKIGDKYSHLQSQGSPSSTFKEILKNDYPDYKYT
jgi:hypothetical protein